MLGYEEKLERIKLIDAVGDAGRLARGLDQLLESLAHADQLDPLDVEGILALRSISEKSPGASGTPRASWRRRTRSFMPRARAGSQRRPPKGNAPLSAGKPLRCSLRLFDSGRRPELGRP